MKYGSATVTPPSFEFTLGRPDLPESSIEKVQNAQTKNEQNEQPQPAATTSRSILPRGIPFVFCVASSRRFIDPQPPEAARLRARRCNKSVSPACNPWIFPSVQAEEQGITITITKTYDHFGERFIRAWFWACKYAVYMEKSQQGSKIMCGSFTQLILKG